MINVTEQEIEMLREAFRKNRLLFNCLAENLEKIYRTPGYGRRIFERLIGLGYFETLPDYYGNGTFNGKRIKSPGIFLTQKGLGILMAFYKVNSYEELEAAFKKGD